MFYLKKLFERLIKINLPEHGTFNGTQRSCTIYARMALIISFDRTEDSLYFSAMLHGLILVGKINNQYNFA